MTSSLSVSLTGDFPFELVHSEIVNTLFELDQVENKKTEKIEVQNVESDSHAHESDSHAHESSSDEDECDPCDDSVEAISATMALKQFDRINAYTKLEQMGYRAGYALVERLSKELPRMSTELDFMKFICKEFWTNVFRKQVDNLRTNHQGVYVIQDSKFWLLTPLSATAQYKHEAPKYIAYSCGLIRGALGNFNLNSTVTASVDIMPLVKFNVQIAQKL